MAEIVNLRTARKRKHRAEAEAKAAESRARHGRSGREQIQTSLTRRLEEARLAGHRREPQGSDEPAT